MSDGLFRVYLIPYSTSDLERSIVFRLRFVTMLTLRAFYLGYEHCFILIGFLFEFEDDLEIVENGDGFLCLITFLLVVDGSFILRNS